MTIPAFLDHITQSLESMSILAPLEKFMKDGTSTAGRHSMEELFTREFLCPTMSNYFRETVRAQIGLSDNDIKLGLGTEGFQGCEGYGFSPARRSKHLFTKSDIIKAEPPPSWTDADKTLPSFQACPDFAIRHPLPFRAVGEVKFFREGSPSSAIKELFNAARQAVFYLGAFIGDYDSAIVVVADASPEHVFKSTLKDMHPELLSRFGDESRVHLAVVRLR